LPLPSLSPATLSQLPLPTSLLFDYGVKEVGDWAEQSNLIALPQIATSFLPNPPTKILKFYHWK
jgi:hypothetical protein